MSLKSLAGRRAACLLALASALVALLVIQGQANGAPTCTITWSGPAGGNWSDANNWTPNQVPTGSDDVCITAPGADVLVNSSQFVGTITVGAAGSTPDQKVTLQGSGVQLATSSGFTIEGTGVVDLADGGASYTALNGSGAISNNGTLRSSAGAGYRAIWASLVNNGTFTIAADTRLDGSSKTYTNAGTITVADSIPVTLNSSDTLTQKDGATLTNDGTITTGGASVRIEGGQLAGAHPLEMTGVGTLEYAADATETVPGTISLPGSSSGATNVKGDVPLGSTLKLNARDYSAMAKFVAPTGSETSVTNRGTIVLDSTQPGYYAQLQGLKMVNQGTIRLAKSVAGAHSTRYLSSEVDNEGTLQVDAGADANYQPSTTLLNNGTLTVATGASLAMSAGGTLDQRGTLTVNGTFVTDSDDTLRIASTSTSAPGGIEMQGGTLVYALPTTAHLPLTIKLTGSSSGATTVKGDVPADSTLRLDGRNYLARANFVAPNGTETEVTNRGTIELDSAQAGYYAQLQGLKVVNLGTIHLAKSVADGNSTRYLSSEVDNEGTLQVDAGVDANYQPAATLLNNGTLTVATGASLVMSSAGTLDQQGTLTVNGTFATDADDILRIASTNTSAANGIVMAAGTLELALPATAHLPLTFKLNGSSSGATTVKGDVPAETTLRIDGSSYLATANFVAPTGLETSVTNRGTIELDSAQAGYYPRLDGVKMVNEGTISLKHSVANANASRYLDSEIDNQGTITGADGVSAIYRGDQPLVNHGTFTVPTGESLTFQGAQTFEQRGTLNVDGSLGLDSDDTLVLASADTNVAGGLTMAAGTLRFDVAPNTSLPLTVELDGSSSGATNVRGDIPSGTTLHVFAHSYLATANFAPATGSETSATNNGTIVLDSDQPGYYPRVTGLPVVNEGTIRTQVTGTGNASSYIQTAVTNNGTLAVGSGSDLSLTTLDNLSGTTLADGEYDLAGTLRITGSTPDVRTNAALITLRANGKFTAADGTTSALANLATNASGGTLVLAGRSLTVPGAFTNAGGVVIGDGDALGTQTGDYVQTGGLTRLAGTATLDPASQADLQGGRLDGTGTVAGDLANAATVIPGTDVSGTITPGTLHVTGAYTQAPAGELKTQVDDATHASYLQVDGNSALDGTLTITRKAGYTPAPGEGGDIVGGGGQSGAFATVNPGTGHPRYLVGYAPAAGAAITWADVPGAPGNVLATAGNKTASVNWTAAADNADPVTGYTVRAHPSDNSGDVTKAVDAATRSTTITGLTNGKAYDVTVTAANSLGTGAVSTAAPASPSNASPTAAFTVSPASPEAGKQVTVTSTATDPDGTIAATAWDLDGDGQYDDATGTTATVTFTAAGDHTVRVRVTDDDGAASTASKTVTVKAAPVTDTGGGGSSGGSGGGSNGGGSNGGGQTAQQPTAPAKPVTQTPTTTTTTPTPTTPAAAKAAATAVLGDVTSDLTQAGTTVLASSVVTDVVVTEPGTYKMEVLAPSGSAARAAAKKAKLVVLASGAKKFAAAGKGKVRIKATSKGRSVLKRAKTLKVTIRTTFTPVGGKPVVSERKVTLKAKKKKRRK